ncbi:transketolase [Cellulomonas sp. HZM]|uniref:transketolase family protein n=1 Tax=Cellulomonas sp. HZM TaxID=1454010 RepID=UPI0005583AD2|nr:transketolase [Cellulomonas sp. HZM]
MTSTPALDLPTLDWTDHDTQAVTAARLIAMDAVEAAGHGHPGTAVSLAPVGHLLFQHHLRHDPADPDWRGRDRFVLSCGHTSLTLYTQLYLAGYPLTLDDIKAYRKLGSLTPAHPERGHTAGVETTTGPLGQGLATAVGIAMGARRERGLLDPDAPVGQSPFDFRVFVLCSDGDLQEGVTAEASAFAGHQALGNLVVVYDDNRISIEGSTALASTEDTAARYEAYGWHVQTVDLAPDGDVDVVALSAALDAATAETGRPSIVLLRSIIAWPVPGAQGTAASHGSALGADAVRLAKSVLGADPDATFAVPPEVVARTQANARARAAEARAGWDEAFEAWAAARPEEAALLARLDAGEVPGSFAGAMPRFEPGTTIATRKAFGRGLAVAAGLLPEVWGGSADLGESNGTNVAPTSFLPASSTLPGADPAGSTIHWGIREHFMGAAMNGIALSGRSRPYGGTFLVFSDYMRPAVRLAALMGLPTLYVWTHDSIGLGEDGPTHQPVEHLASLRAMPGLDVLRPGDANETAVLLWRVLSDRGRPVAFSLSRQDLPVLPEDRDGFSTSALAVRGGYVRWEGGPGDELRLVLLATGSELHVAVSAAKRLAASGVRTRVVSMPCREWFDEQDAEYRDLVLPPGVRARVAVEAASRQSWYDLVGLDGRVLGVDAFGASASAQELFEQFGLTPDHVVEAALEVLQD